MIDEFVEIASSLEALTYNSSTSSFKKYIIDVFFIITRQD